MPRSLLQTKVSFPPKPPTVLPRQRLLERLNETQHRQLTLVSAAAGSGKTTLLSTWLDTLDIPVSWLSLDHDDNDPAQFFAYWWLALSHSIPDIQEGALDIGVMGTAFSWKNATNLIINQIAAFSDDLIFVFDDYHLIENDTLHQALTYLFDHQPSNLHLVLLTRSDPPLPLARLRGRSQLLDIRNDDLRFNPVETRHYLELAGISTTDEMIAALDRRTEGWAVGIQLTLQSLHQQADNEQFLKDFTGTPRYLLDYLVEEVIGQQPEHIQHFLLRTSILNRFNGVLCDKVTGRDDSQQMLEQLAGNNLFVIPLDASRQWYRYHALFADLLRHRLQRLHSEEITELHRRAYQWYADNAYIGEAIRHALAAGEVDQAATLIIDNAMPALQAGQQFTVLSWIESIPEDKRHHHPGLLLWHAWVLLFVGRVSEHHPSIELADRLYAEKGNQHGQGQVLTFQANLARLRGDALLAVEQAQRAQDLLPDGDRLQRGINILTLGDGYTQLGDVNRARPYLQEAQIQGRAVANLLMELIARNRTADGYFLQGQLQQAAEAYQQVLDIAGERPVWQRTEAQTGLAKIHLEWNELEEAGRRLENAFQLAEETERQIYLTEVYLTQAQLNAAHEDGDKAEAALNQALVTARRFDHETVVRRVEAVQARLHLQQGDMQSAAYWLERINKSPSPHPLLHEEEGLTAIRILLAQSKSEEALGWITTLEGPAGKAGRTAALIELHLLAALVYELMGDRSVAMERLHQSLLLAEPAGYLRIYVNEGQPMQQLLQLSYEDGILLQYVERILSACSPSPAAMLIEPLTDREMDVLRLIAEGYTNQQIADEFVIALTTAKKHVSNILGKLAVDNRTEAAAKARQIGYL
jgi:LuxR family maltose regulon positive regulatory protein